ncbi:RNAse III [Abditibacterium utsteinense]|uniref:Ribonuclease 3 n=1 Tax=Abditibacterium utsteinense TaxID=1960156 RepID=A0A2S8SVG3_9BACT|nr:ribonuclease III [Abditibacterium utsteinense]PQV64786.1 RNAse III [Abditibacterium utsteinense]
MTELETILGLEIPEDLLELALSHPSAVGEGLERTLESNQRLEFLGDALVGAVVAAYFYKAEPNLPEGQLTNRKIAAVRREALGAAAQRLDLGRFLRFGRGEGVAGGAARLSNLSDAFEALIGAIYLAHGWETAQSFVLKNLAPELSRDPETLVPFKNRLQELTQAIGLGTPRYQSASMSAKVHQFSSQVLLLDEVRGRGQGTSKKAAEEEAAKMALDALLESSRRNAESQRL